MNKFGHLLILLFGIMTGCIDKQPQLKNNILKIDLDADYPSKDLAIQELMDVEYIALETSGDVVCEG
ncbi:MAG: hypothetical protein E7099_04560 [Mediterranea massiliensis]|nr:hypothetical protein [Mediterranea massiliensis]